MTNAKNILDFLQFSNPTEEQKTALLAMQGFVNKDNKEDFLILCGAAGTGKTSITTALIGFLNARELKYRIAAPTGRAARILGRKAQTVASTVHSMIYTPESKNESGSVVFKLKKPIASEPTVYIIDEASMIPIKADNANTMFTAEKGLLFDLVSYIKGCNANNKIIFLGDHYQLPPINEQKSFALQADFLKQTFNFQGQAYLLTEVKRQADGSYILQNATDIRKAIDEGKSSHPILGKKSDNIYRASESYVKDYLNNPLDSTIAIGVSNKANDLFNRLVRDQLFSKSKKIIEPGDLLMVTQNWTRNDVRLFNGDHVQVISIDWSLQETVANLHFVAVRVKPILGDDSTIIEDYMLLDTLVNIGDNSISAKENNLRRERYIKNKIYSGSGKPEDDRYVGALRLVYGHAITCNKAQGGEWKKVYINTMGIPNLKWQYTAVTRAKEEIVRF